MVRTIGVLLCVASVIGPTPSAAQTRDTVILRSGNPIIGEVKSLRRGTLDFDTAEMDVVGIDWDDIALLSSGAIFEVESASGVEYVGSLASADTALLVIVGLTRADTLPFAAVVRIAPIEPGFWARTNGFVDLGTNFAKAKLPPIHSRDREIPVSGADLGTRSQRRIVLAEPNDDERSG